MPRFPRQRNSESTGIIGEGKGYIKEGSLVFCTGTIITCVKFFSLYNYGTHRIHQGRCIVPQSHHELINPAQPLTTQETQAAAALLCDIMITVSLVRSLRKNKSNVKSTNSLLNSLMINAVNRGMLTATCAALNLILFIALPGTFYFFIGVEMSGKLYMNSALATYGPSHRFRSSVLI
ncbi:hypothetical protein BDZ97DRAFT_1759796 [Flammula alnicola]|nr:hypothetical protein BDZ97DRAFT_1759796 [Flammula alnicola]